VTAWEGRWQDLQYLDNWSLWSQVFFPLAVALLLANAVFIFINILAIWRRSLHQSIGRSIYLSALLVPLYWVLISVAAWKGFLQLLNPRKAHYWEKTQHGLTQASEPAAARQEETPAAEVEQPAES
jgi:endonuclease/exonuclease/phosphatase (EEP) superfamily protein YafD